MKGAVYQYDKVKGFGFLKDENGEQRFFHINEIADKVTFLNNLEDYWETTWVDRVCYVVEFTPAPGKVGLAAKNIKLTEQVLNDKNSTGVIPVKIVDVRKEVDSVGRIMQGIKKGQPKPFGATAGGNGTYQIGYPEVTKNLFIDFIRTDDIGWGSIDVWKLVLAINDRSNVTDRLVATLKQKLIGKAARMIGAQDKWLLKDLALLKL